MSYMYHMQPGIGGIPWGSSALQNPIKSSIPVETGVLSIIHLKIVSDVSVLIKSSPTAELWSATVQYISTIPGCAAIYWGTEAGQDDKNICLLIQWQNPMSWNRFQKSMALSLMLPVLAENPSNRCALLLLPRNVTTPQAITLFCVTFPLGIRTENREQFSNNWKKLEESWTKEAIEVRGGWLEDDVKGWLDHEGQEGQGIAQQLAQHKHFCALVFAGEQRAMDSRENVDLMGLFNKGLETDQLLSVREFLLTPTTNWQVRNSEVLSEAIRPLIYDFGSLLKLSAPRHYNEKTGIFYNQDLIQGETINATMRRERKFPAPHGGFSLTGHISQYRTPALAARPVEAPDQEPHCTADFIWLVFKPEVLDSDDVKNAIVEYRWKLRKREGCSYLVWCSSVGKPYECAMIIYWSNATTHTSNSQFVYDATMEFMETTSSLICSPQIFGIATGYKMWDSRHPGYHVFPIVELITFEVPVDRRSQDLIQWFYDELRDTTGTNLRRVGETEPKACHDQFAFFHNQPLRSLSSSVMESQQDKSDEKELFTGCVCWRSEEAMQSWTTDYTDGMKVYERLGHQIDALQLVCPEVKNVQSRFLKEDVRLKYDRRFERKKLLG